jgi:putative acetyltransferase
MANVIREETDRDRDPIRQVHRLAFGRDAEARLVDALREGGYVRAALVAEMEGQVAGHILFSDLPILVDGGTVPALALAPLAVRPEVQSQGLGSALVRRGLEVCKEQGHRIVVVLGHPTFYQRFGFSAQAAARLDSPFSGRESFMAVELVPGALNQVSGKVVYPPPFEIGPQVPPTRPTAGLSRTKHHLSLLALEDSFAVSRLGSDAPVPPWATAAGFCCVTRTAEELSVVCRQEAVPEGVRSERGWRGLRVAGPLPFATVGVLAALTVPLAEAGVSVFAVSTFDTDYLLVKEAQWDQAVAALRRHGHEVR